MGTISREDYLKAKEKIIEYEKQLDLFNGNITCYLMHRTKDNLIFVTVDKEYADRLYSGGEYIMKVSQLVNP
jgi:hypothetical protein